MTERQRNEISIWVNDIYERAGRSKLPCKRCRRLLIFSRD